MLSGVEARDSMGFGCYISFFFTRPAPHIAGVVYEGHVFGVCNLRSKTRTCWRWCIVAGWGWGWGWCPCSSHPQPWLLPCKAPHRPHAKERTAVVVGEILFSDIHSVVLLHSGGDPGPEVCMWVRVIVAVVLWSVGRGQGFTNT